MKSVSRPIVLLAGIVIGAGSVAAAYNLQSTSALDQQPGKETGSRSRAAHLERLEEVMALINAKKLRTYSLSGSTDASLQRLEDVNNLREIDLNSSAVTDTGIKRLTKN